MTKVTVRDELYSRLQAFVKVTANARAEDVAAVAKALVPVDTGRLRDSIGIARFDDIVVVGAKASYAKAVEYGTRYTRAQPFLRPALDQVKARK